MTTAECIRLQQAPSDESRDATGYADHAIPADADASDKYCYRHVAAMRKCLDLRSAFSILYKFSVWKLNVFSRLVIQ